MGLEVTTATQRTLGMETDCYIGNRVKRKWVPVVPQVPGSTVYANPLSMVKVISNSILAGDNLGGIR